MDELEKLEARLKELSSRIKASNKMKESAFLRKQYHDIACRIKELKQNNSNGDKAGL